MKTLHEIQNDLSKALYECSFVYATSFLSVLDMRDFMQEVARRYAEEAIKEVAKIAKIVMLEVGAESITEVNKETILNLINELSCAHDFVTKFGVDECQKCGITFEEYTKKEIQS